MRRTKKQLEDYVRQLESQVTTQRETIISLSNNLTLATREVHKMSETGKSLCQQRTKDLENLCLARECIALMQAGMQPEDPVPRQLNHIDKILMRID